MLRDMEYTLSVPACRGKMGDAVFYTAVFPVHAVTRLFAYDPEKMVGLDPEERTQRALNRKRIPEIADYITSHRDYVFSSITVSIEDGGKIKFEPVEKGSDIGTLKLPMDCEFVVNDGQHRVAGMAEAILQNRALENDSISVVIFPGSNKWRSQQIFSDLNRTVQKTSRSLDILFDHRSLVNRLTSDLANTVPLFQGRVDKERQALSGRSHDFTSLYGLQAATTQLLGGLTDLDSVADYEHALELATMYWNHLTDIIPPWSDIASGELRPDQARADYVSVYTLVLWALGSVGGTVFEKNRRSWKRLVDPLKGIDWLKSNPEWQGMCMIGPEVVTRGPARRATADLLHWKLDLGPKPKPVLPLGESRPRRRAKS
jgi:DNA sulfur modification protein DndB